MLDLRTSIPVLLRERARANPDGVLLDSVDGPSYTNSQFHDAAIRLSNGLAGLGVEPGDRVATMLDPEPVAYVCWIAIAWRRALEVPTNPEFAGSALVHQLNDSGADTIITNAGHLETITGIADELTELERVILVDAAGTEGDRASASRLTVVTLESLLESSDEEPTEAPSERDPYAVIYTSGTTGPSKGVVMPWGNISVAASSMFPGDDPADYRDGGVYSPWPTFHSAAKAMMAYAAMAGLRVVLRKRFSLSAFWDDIRAHNCTHVHLLGFGGALLGAEPRPDDAENPLRRALLMPVPPGYKDFEARFGVKISTGWGQTEIGFPVSIADPVDHRTCGRLSDDYEGCLLDGDDYEVAEGEVGEMCVRPRRPWIMIDHYWGRWQATAENWANGWFHTGDLLRRDPEGNYYFVDRKKDYVRVRGNNVSSMELEAHVRIHDEVVECAVVGIPSATGEQDIVVFASRSDGSELTEEVLVAHLSERVPKYMVPAQVLFVEDFPRTPTGKIQKAKLRDQATATS